MDHIGIDVHKRESQIYILAEGGEVIEQRIDPSPEGMNFGVKARRAREPSAEAVAPSAAPVTVT